jgi:hypothetical protein
MYNILNKYSNIIFNNLTQCPAVVSIGGIQKNETLSTHYLSKLQQLFSDTVSKFADKENRKWIEMGATIGSSFYNFYRLVQVSKEIKKDNFYENRSIAQEIRKEIEQNTSQVNRSEEELKSLKNTDELLSDIQKKLKRHYLSLIVHGIRIIRPVCYFSSASSLQKFIKGSFDTATDSATLFRYTKTTAPELQRNHGSVYGTWKDKAHNFFKASVTAINLFGNLLVLLNTFYSLEESRGYQIVKGAALGGMSLDILYGILQKNNFFEERSNY